MVEALKARFNGERRQQRGWEIAALVLALAGGFGSLYLSVGMGLKACPLCFYQRSFVMSAAAILLTGWVVKLLPSVGLCGLTLPLAVSGLGVALFHEYLELTGKLECPSGVLGVGTAPQQSLALFVLFVGVLAVGSFREWRAGAYRGGAIAVAVLLGAVLAGASVWSTPPMPAAPQSAYQEPLLICRPPYLAR